MLDVDVDVLETIIKKIYVGYSDTVILDAFTEIGMAAMKHFEVWVMGTVHTAEDLERL